MSKILIHAGLHKTGTSAIQNFLFDNNEALLSRGFNYPNMKPLKSHHRFANRLINYSVEELNLAINDVNSTLIDLSNKTKANCLILSSEMLSEGLNPSCFKSLNQIFSEIEFHFYIRRQDELLESAYNQQIKRTPEKRNINEYKPYFTDIYLHLNRFKENIPNSKIYAHVYDKKILKNQDVVEDFTYNILGINDLIPPKTRSYVNESLSPVACFIMMMVNRFELNESSRLDVLNYLFENLSSKEYKCYKLLSDKEETELFCNLKESNRLLDKEFLGFDYMSNLEPRSNKTYLTYQDAFNIAKEKGIIYDLKAKYDLDLKI
jgi:hypothetical protein